MPRIIRYQGAIVQGDKLLLICHREHISERSYWLFPGGGIEAGETAEACVAREMLEETGLSVKVEHLLLDEAIPQPDVYKRRHTYLCSVLSGNAAPGYEPEADANEHYGIVEVAWFNLRHPESWSDKLKKDSITYPQVMRVRSELGYASPY